MNFLAATALLFVSPEDAFWFLIAVTERYFDKAYFDQNLSGAQADQEVLKELVEVKFPKLSKHLDECDIDLTTVTLNWFLALFFDAVPFQVSILRSNVTNSKYVIIFIILTEKNLKTLNFPFLFSFAASAFFQNFQFIKIIKMFVF